jgi:S1-C subfamily serine protease
MFKAFLGFVKLLFCLMFILPLNAAPAQNSIIDKLQKASDSIVEIKTVYAKALKGQPVGDRASGLVVTPTRLVSYERNGAGVILDASGLVVTNTHTIINAPHIFVVLNDGTKLEAQVAFVSPTYDFSFLKVNFPKGLKPMPLADSSKTVLGQSIIVIGNSEYNNRSILSGEVVNIFQSQSTGEVELIGVNLDLYRGDSGGPIIDAQGRLLGIVMAKEKSKQRSSIAIASNKIREQYVQYRKKMP